MALLAAEPFRLDHGDPLDSRLLQRLLHLVELERLDDRLDLLHGGETPCPARPRPSRLRRERRGVITPDFRSRHGARRARNAGFARSNPVGGCPSMRQFVQILSRRRLNARTPFAGGENPPGHAAPPSPPPSARTSPRRRDGRRRAGWRQAIGFSGRADGPVFVAVGVLHQDRADEIGPELAGEVAPGQPFALVVAADLRSAGVDRRSRRRAGSRRTAFPPGFFSSAISSAEQHIVQDPQDLPGAAAMSVSVVAATVERADQSPPPSLPIILPRVTREGVLARRARRPRHDVPLTARANLCLCAPRHVGGFP